MNYLLDANSIICLLSGTKPQFAVQVAATEAGEIGVSAVSFAEGVHCNRIGKSPELPLPCELVEEIPVVPFDQLAAQACADLPYMRDRYDRLIAARALSIGAALVMNNETDFADVPGLKVENWTK